MNQDWQGSGSVKRVAWSAIKGRNIIIWPDNDGSSVKAKDDLLPILTPNSNFIKVVDQTLLKIEKGDIADIDPENTALVENCLNNAETVKEPIKEWMKDCVTTVNGTLERKSTHNAILFLTHDEAVAGMVGYDHTFSNVVIDHNVDELGLIDYKDDPFPRTLRSTDVIKYTAWLETKGIFLASKTVKSVIQTVSFNNQFDSLYDWLNGISWDGVQRIDKFFADYLKVKPSEYTTMVSRLFFIALVSRRLDPGGKMDNYFILEGKGGQHKGKFLKILGGKYYKEGLPDFRGKEFFYAIKDGAWIVEDDEMNLQRRADAKANKGFITRQRDEQRVVFEDDTTKIDRAFVLIGTTNDHGKQYLEDQTGNRRYLPVHVCPGGGKIDYHAVEEMREQLFAEAAHFFKLYQTDLYKDIKPEDSEYRWWLNEEDELIAQAEQEVRTTDNPFVDLILYTLEIDLGFKRRMQFEGMPMIKIYQYLNDGRNPSNRVIREFKNALKLVGLAESNRIRIDGVRQKTPLWKFPDKP